MIYLDNASTSFHKPDCVARAVVEAMQQAGNSEEEAVEKQWKPQGLFLIQDAGSLRCLMQKDRNVWHLPQTQQKL